MDTKELIKLLRADAEYTDDIGLSANAADAIEQLAASLAAKDEVLRNANVGFDLTYTALEKNFYDEAMMHCGHHHAQTAKALTLQPHAELVAKMKAEAVRETVKKFVIQPSTQANAMNEYADRIERGEVCNET